MIEEGLKENALFDKDTMFEHTSVFQLREKMLNIKSMALIIVALFIKNAVLLLKHFVQAPVELCNKSFVSPYNGIQDC